MTRWRPDTCDCIIDVEDWDLGIATIVSACKYHQGLSDKDHFDVVYNKENKLKNQVLAEVVNNVSSIVEIKTPESVEYSVEYDKDGNIITSKKIVPAVVDLKTGVSFHFAFDKNRQLNVVFAGTDKAEHAEVVSALSKFTQVQVIDVTDL